MTYTLHVKAVSGKLVANLDALMNKPSVRRFIGYRYDAEQNGYVSVPAGEVITTSSLEYYNEYLKAIKSGDLVEVLSQGK